MLAAGVAAWRLLARQEDPLPPAAREAQARLAAVDRWAAVAEAELVLATVRADLTGEPTGGGLQARVDHVEGRLEGIVRAMDDPDAPAWDELASNFERLERQLRRDDPAALETLDALDATLRGLGP